MTSPGAAVGQGMVEATNDARVPDMTVFLRFGVIGIAVVLCCGCDSEAATTPTAAVRFAIDAPLCSSVIPVQFFVDHMQVGVDTFRVGVTPEHTISAPFALVPGSHLLGAQVVGGFVWPDSLVAISVGTTFTRSLPFYCS